MQHLSHDPRAAGRTARAGHQRPAAADPLDRFTSEPTKGELHMIAEKIAADTDANDHTTARLRIAAAFAWMAAPEIARCEAELRGIAALHAAVGDLPAWAADAREQLTERLLQRICLKDCHAAYLLKCQL